MTVENCVVQSYRNYLQMFQLTKDMDFDLFCGNYIVESGTIFSCYKLISKESLVGLIYDGGICAFATSRVSI